MTNHLFILFIISMSFLCSACHRSHEYKPESKVDNDNILISLIDAETDEVVQKVVFSSDKTLHDLNFLGGNGRWDIGYKKIIVRSDLNGTKTTWKYNKSDSRFYGYHKKYYFSGTMEDFKKLLIYGKAKEKNEILRNIIQEN